MAITASPLPDPSPCGDPPAGPVSDRPTAALLPASWHLAGTLSAYRRRQEIFGEGEEAACVYRVVQGAVRSYVILSDGRRQIDAFHLPGDLFGLSAQTVHRQSAEAILETTLMVYRRRQFEAAAQRDVRLVYGLWSMALSQLEAQQAHLLLLGRRSALERVAAFLTQIERRSGGGGWFCLPMTRRDIADYLGLTIETVSRAITQLVAQGALMRAGARRVRLRHGAIRPLLDE